MYMWFGAGYYSNAVLQMHQQGILKTDDLITRFFRLCTEMCVELTYGTLKNSNASPAVVRAKCFQTLDAYVRLIVLLVKLSGDSTNTMSKLNLLNKVRFCLFSRDRQLVYGALYSHISPGPWDCGWCDATRS